MVSFFFPLACYLFLNKHNNNPIDIPSVTSMPLPNKPTRLDRTEQRYRRRTKNLVGQCRKMLGLPNHQTLDYRQFVGWLIGRKAELSRDTWRQYKASVVFFLSQEAEKGNAIASESMELLKNVDVTGCVKKSKKTSGSKQKKVPLKEFKAIMKYLDANPTPWSQDLERWIGAGLLTGLRPAEWANARFGVADGEECLIVDNAKATNGRAHGPTRSILLGGLTDEERQMIAEHVERAREWEQAQQYDKFYHGIASTMARVVRKIWPKREGYPTLYSMRHQFAANAKASGFTREEIAALMGHAVDTTATEHYGRKTAGFDLIRVRPDPAEVAKVRSVFKGRVSPPKPKQDPRVQPVLKPKDAE